jgi:REP element-mobilizing transposase RayT
MSAYQIFFHLTWSTLGRRPMIDASTAAFLDGFFKRIAIRERCEIVEQGLVQTHVHLLVRTPPQFDIPRLAHSLKGGSSFAANREPGNIRGLRWAKEYAVSSVSPRAVPRVVAYLRAQSRHHPTEALIARDNQPDGPALQRSASQAHSSEWGTSDQNDTGRQNLARRMT